MCIKLVIKRNLYYDARSEKHKKSVVTDFFYLTCIVNVNTVGSHIVRTLRYFALSEAGLMMASWEAETCSHTLLICSHLLLELFLCLDVNIYTYFYTVTQRYSLHKVLSYQFVRPSVPTKLGSQLMDFHEIWCFSIFKKSVDKISCSIKMSQEWRVLYMKSCVNLW
jgi:hypothetical protein